jgi:hypothetical protein
MLASPAAAPTAPQLLLPLLLPNTLSRHHILLTVVLLLCVLASPAAASVAPALLLLPTRFHRANHSRPPLPLWLSSEGICCSSSCSNPATTKHGSDVQNVAYQV